MQMMSFIFGKATKKNLLKVKELIDTYLPISGQTVSIEKSKIYLNSQFSSNSANRLPLNWSIQCGYLLFDYVGFPYLKGLLKVFIFKRLQIRSNKSW